MKKNVWVISFLIIVILTLAGCGAGRNITEALAEEPYDASDKDSAEKTDRADGETTDSAEPETVSIDYVTLADDDLCTIRSGGLCVIPVRSGPDPEEVPVYRISITNHSSQLIEFSGGYLSDDTSEFTYGTVNGQKIPAMVYAPVESSTPYYLDTSIPTIEPNETLEFYLCTVVGEGRFPTADELTNVSANLYASNVSGDFWYRNYTLALG